MVVDNLNEIGITLTPVEANAPTLVNADAVLALPIPGQLLKTIAQRNP